MQIESVDVITGYCTVPFHNKVKFSKVDGCVKYDKTISAYVLGDMLSFLFFKIHVPVNTKYIYIF